MPCDRLGLASHMEYYMGKVNGKAIPAITREASLAGRAMARLEADAARVLRESENGEKSVKLFADARDTIAIIRIPGLDLELRNGVFAASVTALEKAGE